MAVQTQALEQAATQEAIAYGADPSRLARARQLLGSQEYLNLCERFVEQVSGRTGVYGSAIAAWQAETQAGRTRPGLEGAQPGDAIYFSPNQANQGYGHAGIFAGQGRFINPGPRGVEESGIEDWTRGTGQQVMGYLPQTPGGGGRPGGAANWWENIPGWPQPAYAAEEEPSAEELWQQMEAGQAGPQQPTGTLSPQVAGGPVGTTPGPIPGSYWVSQPDGYDYLIDPGNPPITQPRILQTRRHQIRPNLPAYGEGDWADVVGQGQVGTSPPGAGLPPTTAGARWRQNPNTGQWEEFRTGEMTEYQTQANNLAWARYKRDLAQDEYSKAIDARDFGAAQRWKGLALQWDNYWKQLDAEARQAQAQMQQAEFRAGLATKPTMWASLATRGQQAGGPVNALDWYDQGVAGQNLPEDAYQRHVQAIGGYNAPAGRQAWEQQYRTERGMGQPFALPSLEQMPWYQALRGTGDLAPYRLTPEAIAGGLSNVNFLKTTEAMTADELEQFGAVAGRYGMNLGNWAQQARRVVPRGRAAVARW